MLEHITYKQYKAHKEYKEKIQRRALRIVNAWEWIEWALALILFIILLGVALLVYGGMGVAIVGGSGLL